jgi:hypothetical protein
MWSAGEIILTGVNRLKTVVHPSKTPARSYLTESTVVAILKTKYLMPFKEFLPAFVGQTDDNHERIFVQSITLPRFEANRPVT